MKKLYKSKSNKVLFGLFGGIGEYFDVDPTIIRILAIFLILSSGLIPGIIAYIVTSIIVPKKKNDQAVQ